ALQAELEVDPGVARDRAPVEDACSVRRARPVEARRPRHQRAVQVEEGGALRLGLGRDRRRLLGRGAFAKAPHAPSTRRMSASPWPPPEQIAAQPSPPPRRRSSCTSTPRMRAPDAPIGCPRATAPPLTLTFSSSMPSSRIELSVTDANASLISHRSMSDACSPAFCSALVAAEAGVVAR